jgi:hypothetical protein
MDCDKYRGIALLSVVYNVMSALIANRLVSYAEKVIGECQCGFRQNRSWILNKQMTALAGVNFLE